MHKFLTFLMVILALGLVAAHGQSAEDQYIRIYGLIQDGDRLAAESKEGEAVARYQEARGYLQGLQRGNPGWNEKIVKFRLSYLTRQIETLSAKAQPASSVIQDGNSSGAVAKPATTGSQGALGMPELEQQVGALRSQLKQLQGDKAALELKLKEALAVQPAAADPRELAKSESRVLSLQKENELLRVALDQEKSKGAAAGDAAALMAAKLALDEANLKLASQMARADKLEQEQKALQLEKSALENRVKQLVASSSGVAAASAVPPPYQPDDSSRVKELEKQKRELEKQLAAARKELASRRGKTIPATGNPDLEKQVASLQARLQVLEAAPGPYTAAELALFAPPSSPKPTTPAPARPAPATPPAGTSEMVAQARRFFAARQFDKAEETYLEMLKRDENNVYTLANLASIQIEVGKLEEAEKNVLRASAQAPDDSFTLSVLGHLRYRQARYDEAFETLSRAAQLDPKNADIQNFLGVTLIQKGFRSSAQAAFRRAIQINPDYADAHYNLASACLGQTPPLVELARYHYQKAQAAGFPRNEAFEKELESKLAK
jgi:tetratricopeptide (TPR) repeat protein